MMKMFLMLLIILYGSLFSAIQVEEVEYEVDSLKMKGYLAFDDSKEGKRPGILVVHEWWGHNDYARKRARMLAELGYVALAVDMYGDGKQAFHPEDAGKFAGEVMSSLPVAKARFEAAMMLLQSHRLTEAGQIGAIGYCFGGGVVLHMARMGIDLKGVVSFHGSLGTSIPAEEGAVKARVLVCHGADDPFVPREQIDAFKAEMDAAKVKYRFCRLRKCHSQLYQSGSNCQWREIQASPGLQCGGGCPILGAYAAIL